MNKIELSEEQLAIIEDYCCDDMKKLKKLCNPIIVRIGGISKKDYDDIYSLAQFLLWNILSRRIYATYIRDKNRQCRSNTKEDENGNKIFIPDVSLDAPTLDCVATMERISSSTTLEDEFFKPDISKKMKQYLHNLSSEQLEVAHLFMDGYKQEDIKDILHMSQSEFNNCMNGMRVYRNISIIM